MMIKETKDLHKTYMERYRPQNSYNNLDKDKPGGITLVNIKADFIATMIKTVWC